MADSDATRTEPSKQEIELHNQRVCERLVEREVDRCVSLMVHHFAQHPSALDGSECNYDDDVQPLLSRLNYEDALREQSPDYHRQTDCLGSRV